jgi:hypothetical protein
MAKAAAPYLHSKMQATALSIDDGLPVCPVINLTISRGPADSSEGEKQAALGVQESGSSKLN